MGWGLSVTGLDALLDAFEELRFRVVDDTVFVVAPTVEYAIYVDRGTAKMEGRPFARPAAERVQADPIGKARAIAAAQGIDISTTEGLLKALALAVEREMKLIITQKGAVDTGQLRASVGVEKV